MRIEHGNVRFIRDHGTCKNCNLAVCRPPMASSPECLRIPLIVLASASLALAGCATLSTDECSTGDWQKIGVQDGNDGRTLDRFSRHASACKLDKTEASRNLYISGRQEGLKVYCTTVRGYREGALGQTYNGVCPAGTNAQFLKGYELGKRIHQIEARSSFVLDEYHAVTQKLLSAGNEAERTQLPPEAGAVGGGERTAEDRGPNAAKPS